MYLLYFGGMVCSVIVLLYLYILYKARQYETGGREQKTNQFVGFADPKNPESTISPPPLDAPPVVKFSLVVPAYNEELRIRKMLDETIEYMNAQLRRDPTLTYEIVVVNDGSRDKTPDVVLQYIQEHGLDRIRLVRYPNNRGKGYAVKQGMLCSRGEYMLMVDADGATDINDLAKLYSRLQAVERDGFGVAVGSRRAETEGDDAVKRTFLRQFISFFFHLLICVLGVRGIEDTQCGFKLFTRRSGQLLFWNMHIERWCFDIEVLLDAQKLHMPIAEVQVNWHEVEGSKLSVIDASIQMARDMFLIRVFHLLGIWHVRSRIE